MAKGKKKKKMKKKKKFIVTHLCYGVSISTQLSESELDCAVFLRITHPLLLIASILYSCCFLTIKGDSLRLC